MRTQDPGSAAPGARFDDLVAGKALEFDRFDEVLVAERADQVPSVLRRVQQAVDGGRWAAGYVAYEAAPAFDDRLRCRPPRPGHPAAWFGLAASPVQDPGPLPDSGPVRLDWQAQWDQALHAEKVAAVHAAIARGDTYQCNLTTRLTAETPAGLVADPAARRAWYGHLTARQRGSLHAHLETGRLAVLSASPELFLRHADGQVTVRPMKGTAARRPDPAEDVAARRALQESEKDRAENVMIVDLMRNDVARISRTGTVAVTDLLACEAYPTLWQLTSTVTGRTLPGTGLPELFAALFPCGSITGAPKASTMDLIAELEPEPRGVYCGAIGYLAPAGHPQADGGRSAGPEAVFSVAIRTVVLDLASGTAEYGVGGGITWSSDPVEEYREIEAKSRILTEPGDVSVVTAAGGMLEA